MSLEKIYSSGKLTIVGLLASLGFSGCATTYGDCNREILQALNQTGKTSNSVNIHYSGEDKDGLKNGTIQIVDSTTGKVIEVIVLDNIKGEEKFNGEITFDKDLEPNKTYSVEFILVSNNCDGGDENTTKIIKVETSGKDSEAKVSSELLSLDEDNNAEIEVKVTDLDGISKVTVVDSEGNTIIKEYDLNNTDSNLQESGNNLPTDFTQTLEISNYEGHKVIVTSKNGETKEMVEKEGGKIIFEVYSYDLAIFENKDGEIGVLPEGTNYKIVGEELNSPFYIQDGKLFTNREFDYETKAEYEITIEYINNKGEKIVQKVQININDLYETPVKPEPTNHAPEAKNDSTTTEYGTSVMIDVLKNDTDKDGDILSIESVGTPKNGTAKIENGKIKYTPEKGFSGVDTFEYTISDGKGGENKATVSVTVKEKPNTIPNTNDDKYDTAYNTEVSGNVLSNDIDAEGDEITVISNTNPLKGTLTILENGDFTYRPNDGETGTDSFTYTVNGGNSSKVTINIDNAPNQAPVINQTNFDGENGPASKTFTNVVSDDGNLANIKITSSDLSNGNIIYNGDGSITYTMDSGKVGDDSGNVTFSDGEKSTTEFMTFKDFDNL